ncbi:MAG: heavy metal translocating P-type ATPase metal-binding domain-containing protein [Verrucomicrobiota bacterium]
MSSSTLTTQKFAQADPPIAATARACKHCGTTFSPPSPSEKFCCNGCAFVHQLLTSENLQRFYDLKGKTILPPVKSRAFETRDFAWLKPLIQQAQQESSSASNSISLTLGLQGLSCIGCVWLVETLFTRQPGALRIIPNLRSASVTLSWRTHSAFDLPAFAQTLQNHGYLLTRFEDSERDTPSAHATLNTRLGLCGAFAANAMAFTLPRYLGLPASSSFAPLFDLAAAASATLALLVGGTWFFQRAWSALKTKTLHIDLPISLGILAAYTGSILGWLFHRHDLFYFDFVAIFIFLMLAGRWLQLRAVEKNRLRARAASTIPTQVDPANHDDGQTAIPVANLKPDDEFLTRPGQVIPVAARLASPHAALSLEWINGESDPRDLPNGAAIPAGALNVGTNPIHLVARESWSDSLLAKLTDTTSSSTSHPIINSILKGYLATILAVGFIGATAWLLATNDPVRALQVLISVFVVSCPCAIGLALPLADDLAASAAEKIGVFIRRPLLWARLKKLRKVLFDKTGTLTLERLTIENPDTVHRLDPAQKQALWTLTATNPHPVARSLFEALAANTPAPTNNPLPSLQMLPGHGVQFTDPSSKNTWELRRPDSNKHDTEFLKNDALIATFSFRESLRPQAKAQINRLREQNLTPYILSGDRESKVAAVAAALNLKPSHWRARMTPDEKAAWVHELDPNHCSSLYLGDGANDSLAFDRAAVTATPVIDGGILESKADFYFLGHSLAFIGQLLSIARRRHQAVVRVFAFAILYNLVAATLALSGLMTPLLAAILMPLSSIATLSLASATMKESHPRF